MKKKILFFLLITTTSVFANRDVGKLLTLLQYTKTDKIDYNADKYDVGYHTFVFNGIMYQGQRNPLQRLKNVPYNFTGKTVLDIGCNQGGMLFALRKKLRWAVGIDYNHKLVNAANRI